LTPKEVPIDANLSYDTFGLFRPDSDGNKIVCLLELLVGTDGRQLRGLRVCTCSTVGKIQRKNKIKDFYVKS